jgi:hypothetical protein
MPSETDKAYYAGIIDGEGCITVSKGKYDHRTLTVAVVMCDEKPVRDLFKEYGGCLFFIEKSNPKWRNAWRWAVKQQKAKRFLEDVLPYLRVKQEQAVTGLVLIGSFTHIGGRATVEQRENQRGLHEKIVQLNSRIA